VVAHRGLLEFLGTRLDETVNVEFLSPDELALRGGHDVPVIVPALTETQLQFLADLREKLLLAPVLAIVNDQSDQQAYRARMSGASAVLNVQQPAAEQQAILRALGGGVCPPAVTTRLWSVNGWAERIRFEQRQRATGTADEPESDPELLLDLLYGPSTISTIAARLYCSERSMYRRVRRLYDALGVSSRAELRVKLVELEMDRSVLLVESASDRSTELVAVSG
jgi:DNA-binding NarL/FixJ family response regulator